MGRVGLAGQLRTVAGLTTANVKQYWLASDKYRFESDPVLLDAIAEQLAPLVPADVQVLAGLEMGGIPVVTALGRHTGLPCAFVRKQAKTYGTCRLAEGADVTGQRVLVVEDVVTSGGPVCDDARRARGYQGRSCSACAAGTIPTCSKRNGMSAVGDQGEFSRPGEPRGCYDDLPISVSGRSVTKRDECSPEGSPARRDGDETGTAEVVVDARGLVTRWNACAERLLGHPADKVVGWPAANLLAEPLARGAVLRVLAGNPERWSGALALRHRDGHRVDVMAIAHHCMPDHEPGSPGSWRVVCPVSGGEPRPEDEDLARWAFEGLPRCSVSIYDAQLRYRHSNEAMEGVVGLPDGAVRGLGIRDITTQPQTVDLSDGLRRAVESGEPVYLESFQRTGGERRIHAWSVDFAPLKDPDGAVRGVALVAHDTTEQFWARKRLVLLNEAASRIGSTLDLTRTASELLEVSVPELADFASIDLLTALESDLEPGEGELSGTVMLRRITHRFAPGTRLSTVLEVGAIDSYPQFSPPARALATSAGVLCHAEDPEFVQWMELDPRRAALIQGQGYQSMMAVPLRARGVTLGVAVFYRRSRPRYSNRNVIIAITICGWDLQARPAPVLSRSASADGPLLDAIQEHDMPISNPPAPAAVDVSRSVR